LISTSNATYKIEYPAQDLRHIFTVHADDHVESIEIFGGDLPTQLDTLIATIITSITTHDQQCYHRLN